MATPRSAADRARRIRVVLWVILLANWAVAAAKLVTGLSSGSAALTADGLHSFVDGGSNIVGLVAMWFSGQPPDAEHPYGHEKFEALASLGIGAMIGPAIGGWLYDDVSPAAPFSLPVPNDE